MHSTTDSTPVVTRMPGASLYGLYVLALGACLVTNLLVRVSAEAEWLPGWALVALALAGAGPLLVAARLFWRLLRRDLDEMMQRIVLEGMAFALIVYVPLAGFYVNLRAAGSWMPRLDPPDILMTPALLVAIGIAVAARRYH